MELTTTLKKCASAEDDRDIFCEQLKAVTEEASALQRQLSSSDADRAALQDRLAEMQNFLSERAATDAAERERAGHFLQNVRRRTLDLGRAPYVLYGVKYIDLVSLCAPLSVP